MYPDLILGRGGVPTLREGNGWRGGVGCVAKTKSGDATAVEGKLRSLYDVKGEGRGVRKIF